MRENSRKQRSNEPFRDGDLRSAKNGKALVTIAAEGTPSREDCHISTKPPKKKADLEKLTLWVTVILITNTCSCACHIDSVSSTLFQLSVFLTERSGLNGPL